MMPAKVGHVSFEAGATSGGRGPLFVSKALKTRSHGARLRTNLGKYTDKELKAVYKQLDNDGDGIVTIEELLGALGLSGAVGGGGGGEEDEESGEAGELAALFRDLDRDGDGHVDFSELMVVAQADRVYDAANADGDESLSILELMKYMVDSRSFAMDDKKAHEFAIALDKNRDGRVNRHEFRRAPSARGASRGAATGR